MTRSGTTVQHILGRMRLSIQTGAPENTEAAKMGAV
jgi:hypothetical protein